MTAPSSPFAAFFVPLARSFEPPVCIYAEQLRAALHLALAVRLETICAPVLSLEYALFQHARAYGLFATDPNLLVDEEYLLQLSASGWQELLISRPSLERIVNLAVEQWRTSAIELLERLAQDADKLRFTFGVLADPTDIQLGISDMHNGGRSAAILSFAGGQRLVYKAKDFYPDAAWRNFIFWLKQSGALWHPTAQNFLECNGYGWAAFVESRPCESVAEQQEFFTRLGNLQALLYLLGATDCHRDNFIVNGSEPVLIDLETLLHPQPLNDPMPIALRNSVLATEILPCRYIGAGNQEIYFPGFDLEWETSGGEILHSGDKLSLREHTESFCAGFVETYKFFMTHKAQLSDLDYGPLAIFRGCTVRYVHRPTMTYALTLRRALRLLDEKTGWNSSFEQLQKFDPAGMSAEAINTIRAAENAALQQLDIPFFTAKADTTTLCWQNGATLAGFFPIPAFDLMKQRVELLSETNLVAQLGKIRHALS